jgi:serine protease Do
MDESFEAGKEKTKKGKGSLVVAIISVAVMFLMLGLVIGVYVLNPAGASGSKALADTASPTADTSGTALTSGDSDNPVVEIAATLSNSVVGVRASSNVPVTDGFDTGQTTQSEDIAYGSGFIFSADGYILTNHHVIADADTLTVVMNDGTEYPATVIGSDSYNDIAVLKIEATGLNVMPIGDSDSVKVGEMAIAIGNPLGEDLSGSVTVGYISAVNRLVQSNTYLQTDAAINPGNSGGPLLNASGQVIGVNALKSTLAGYDESGIAISSEGIGFAIPINRAMDVANQLMTTGTVVRPGIGIQYQALSDEEADMLGVPAGALVKSVVAGGPAALAGVQVNDVIVGVNGEAVKNPEELPVMMSGYKVGESITLDILRGGEKITVTVLVGDINLLTFENQ